MDPTALEGPFATVAGSLLGLLFSYLVLEVVLLQFWYRRLRLREARMAGIAVVSNGVVSGWIALTVIVAATLGAAASPIASFGTTLPGWVYGWLVYEFWYWVQHWGAHKVRLLWCVHSPHHAPGSISMLIGANHHVVEGLFYLPFFAGFMPALCGVDPFVCVALNLVDVVWGSFLHISEEVVPRGRYGLLERFLQTPSHHRVHHAKNVRYLDTNYNSMTLFWDWLFGTLEPLRDDEPVEYGITRDVDSGSFWDTHFREFVLLARDVRGAETWGDKIRFLLKPPGWKPGDDSQTAASRKQVLERESASLTEDPA